MAVHFEKKRCYFLIMSFAIGIVFVTSQVIKFNRFSIQMFLSVDNSNITYKRLNYSFESTNSNNASTQLNYDSNIINLTILHKSLTYSKMNISNKAYTGLKLFDVNTSDPNIAHKRFNVSKTINSNNVHTRLNVSNTLNSNSTYTDLNFSTTVNETYIRLNHSNDIMEENENSMNDSLKHEDNNTVVLTIFTTFVTDKVKENIQLNTIRNWALFLPMFQPIAYMDLDKSPVLVQTALQLGWKVFPIPKVNSYGTPFLKEMFFHAMEVSKSPFHGYVNGDILFNDDLMKSLDAVRTSTLLQNWTSVLMTGERTNVNETVVPYGTPFYKFAVVTETAKNKGILYREDAEDYFFIWKCRDFPWNIIKDVVIGRAGYDNYLVGLFKRHDNVTAVDVTKTVLAVHQTGWDGNQANRKHIDTKYNNNVIGKFHYTHGFTINTPYLTAFNNKGHVYVAERFDKYGHVICCPKIMFL